MIPVKQEYKDFLDSLPREPDKYLDHHTVRFCASLEFLEKHLNLSKINRVLNLGDDKYFHDLLGKFYPSIHVEHTYEVDLRYDFMTNKADEYDLILCMEVIEHVTDRHCGGVESSTYTGNGINSMLLNCSRLLKPYGNMFITTPNVCSYYALWNILNRNHPYFYQPHTRELVFQDIYKALMSVGLHTQIVEYLNALWIEDNYVFEKCKKIFVDAGFSSEDRGNSMFILAEKF